MVPNLFESAISFQVMTVKVRNGESWGSGIILDDANGIIATCSHVVSAFKTGKIQTYFHPEPIVYEVIDRGYEDENDVALLKADLGPMRSGNFPSNFAKDIRIRPNSNPISSGEAVMLCGYPDIMADYSSDEDLVDLPVLTWGITSKFPISDVEDIVVSALISPGNSGGPCFDSAGNLIGLASASKIFGLAELVTGKGKILRPLPANYAYVVPITHVLQMAKKNSLLSNLQPTE